MPPILIYASSHLLLLLLIASIIPSVISFSSVSLKQNHNPQYTILFNHDEYFTKVHKPTNFLSTTKRSYLSTETSNVPLSGNLLQVVCDIKIGSQTFVVQVDTGSTLLAVPETGCTGCDTNTPDPYLSSSSNVPLSCSDSLCSAGQCSSKSTSTCGFQVTYVDGSAISGSLVKNTVSLGDLSATNALFGAITRSSANFEAPVSDGIIGFAYYNPSIACSPNCVSPIFDIIVSETGVPDIFTIFLDYQGAGTLTLGGIDNSLLTSAVSYTPVLSKSFYSISLTGLQVAGTDVVTGSSNFGAAIVDSGTSLLVVPSNVYSAIKNYIQSNYADLPLVTGSNNLWQGSDSCFLDSRYISQFPPLQFVFDGVTVTLPPNNYLFQTVSTDGTTIYCLGISSGSSDQTILGDVFLRGLVVVFDRVQNQVGFAASGVVPSVPSGGDSPQTPDTPEGGSSSGFFSNSGNSLSSLISLSFVFVCAFSAAAIFV